MRNPIFVISDAIWGEKYPIDSEILFEKYVKIGEDNRMCVIDTCNRKYIDQILDEIKNWPDEKQPFWFHTV